MYYYAESHMQVCVKKTKSAIELERYKRNDGKRETNIVTLRLTPGWLYRDVEISIVRDCVLDIQVLGCVVC